MSSQLLERLIQGPQVTKNGACGLNFLLKRSYNNKSIGNAKSFSVLRHAPETQIPLNPPLLKGDFTPPLKKGGRGDFHSRG
jgi:hypothetical protein